MAPKTKSRPAAKQPPPAPDPNGRQTRSAVRRAAADPAVTAGPAMAVRSNSKKRKAAEVLPDSDEDIPYEATTDRALVDKPVFKFIAPGMSEAWEISEHFQMCILFDAVNPLRQFKRGTKYNEDAEDSFPDYTAKEKGEVTETDERGELQPYKPQYYRCVRSIHLASCLSLIGVIPLRPVYRFECTITAEQFLTWKEGQLHEIAYGKGRKVAGKREYKWRLLPKKIHVVYARLVSQFIKEAAIVAVHNGHEVLRRQTYAEKMLDKFGRELDAFEGTEESFRSKVFNPVLQRQLRGVADCYAPAIRVVIAGGSGLPTIADVTKFYLGVDPLHPRCIRSYRRNLLYVRESRWHLAIISGSLVPMSKNNVDATIDNQDHITEYMQQEDRHYTADGFPLLNAAEAHVLVHEVLHVFFQDELEAVVCICYSSIHPSSHAHI